jgi:flagellar basal body rod protein FlgG
MSAISAAVSGMQAASLQLDVTANNVANLSTPGFRPSAVALSTGAGGVNAQVIPGTTPGTDLLTEMVTLVTAPILYDANARVIRIAEQTTASLVDAVG